MAEQTKNTINTIGSHFDKLHGELQNIERNILSDVRDEAKSLFEKYEIHKAILLHSRTQVFVSIRKNITLPKRKQAIK